MSGAINAFFAGDESGVGQLIANNMTRPDYIKRIVSIDNYTGLKKDMLYDTPFGEEKTFQSGDISPIALNVLHNAGVLHRIINEGRPPVEQPGWGRTIINVEEEIDKIADQMGNLRKAKEKDITEKDRGLVDGKLAVLEAKYKELTSEFETMGGMMHLRLQ